MKKHYCSEPQQSTVKNGFFVSYKKGREEKAIKELIGVLGNLLETQTKYNKYERINIKEEIENELKRINNGQFKVYFKYKSILYLSNDSVYLPTWFYKYFRKNNVSFSHVLRIIPFDFYFKFDSEKLQEILKDLDTSKTYKILYEERFVPENTKLKVFDCITKFLTLKVDLSNPYYLIVIQCLKNYIGVSIVCDEIQNFNFSKDQLER